MERKLLMEYLEMEKMKKIYREEDDTALQKSKKTLKLFQNQLQKENYNIIELMNLHRDENGNLMGN